jgi:diguanylate cyclase (GGDEF)-like protein
VSEGSSLAARMYALREWLAARRTENDSVAGGFARDNLWRLRAGAFVLLPVSVVHVALFAGARASDTVLQARWRMSVAVAHAIMAVAITALATVAHARLRRPAKVALDSAVAIAGAALALLFGCSLAVIDQWVTPSLTPLVIASIGAGMIFLLRPMQAIALFAVAAAGSIAALGWTQSDPVLLLTNRVNVLSAVAIGAFLSMVLWRKDRANVLLQRALRASHAELERSHAELEALARTDALTGLVNRREFDRLAGLELARARRAGSPTAFIMADLDFFKRINDTFGHPAGDEVLRRCASTLRESVRETDVVARLGGEEVMIVLPNTTESAAIQLAERLRATLAALPVRWEGASISFTASFGVAALGAGCEATIEQVYRATDDALYAAKELGRDRVERASVAASRPSARPAA